MKALLHIFCLIGFFAIAQDGTPDFSFGDDGVAFITVAEGTQYDRSDMTGVGQDSQGNIVTLGKHDNIWYGDSNNYLAKITFDGSLDMAFGNNGFIYYPIQDDIEFVQLHIQNDDKIVVGTSVPGVYDYGLTRFLPDGSLDLSYGNDGSVSLYFEASYQKKWLYSENDNTYFIVKDDNGGTESLRIKKVSPAGTLDVSFGTGGETLFTDPNLSNYSLLDATLVNEEQIIATIIRYEGGNKYFYLIKFDETGNLDTSFGQDGTVQLPIPTDYVHCDILPYDEGDILCSCYSNDDFQKIILISSTGVPDSAFGINGSIDGYLAELVQSNNRIIVDQPEYDWEGGYIPHLSRFLYTGQQDADFNYVSNVQYPLGETFFSLLHNGQFLIASGPVWYSGGSYMTLQKFNNSPLGIEEFRKSNVLVSPNPSTGIFHIEFENFEQNLEYTIYDITGKLVKTGLFGSPNISLDLSSFEAGMYFLNLKGNTIKLIKR